MKKFWRSGMIDKKVVREREQAEYINRLHRTILELRRDDAGYLINDTTDYDEVRIGDNVILDFGGECIIAAPKERLNDSKNTLNEIRMREILDNYKNNIVGKSVSNTEAAEAWMNTMVAFAKEVNKMENE